jgi:hypothetical protein
MRDRKRAHLFAAAGALIVYGCAKPIVNPAATSTPSRFLGAPSAEKNRDVFTEYSPTDEDMQTAFAFWGFLAEAEARGRIHRLFFQMRFLDRVLARTTHYGSFSGAVETDNSPLVAVQFAPDPSGFACEESCSPRYQDIKPAIKTVARAAITKVLGGAGIPALKVAVAASEFDNSNLYGWATDGVFVVAGSKEGLASLEGDLADGLSSHEAAREAIEQILAQSHGESPAVIESGVHRAIALYGTIAVARAILANREAIGSRVVECIGWHKDNCPDAPGKPSTSLDDEQRAALPIPTSILFPAAEPDSPSACTTAKATYCPGEGGCCSLKKPICCDDGCSAKPCENDNSVPPECTPPKPGFGGNGLPWYPSCEKCKSLSTYDLDVAVKQSIAAQELAGGASSSPATNLGGIAQDAARRVGCYPDSSGTTVAPNCNPLGATFVPVSSWLDAACRIRAECLSAMERRAGDTLPVKCLMTELTDSCDSLFLKECFLNVNLANGGGVGDYLYCSAARYTRELAKAEHNCYDRCDVFGQWRTDFGVRMECDGRPRPAIDRFAVPIEIAMDGGEVKVTGPRPSSEQPTIFDPTKCSLKIPDPLYLSQSVCQRLPDTLATLSEDQPWLLQTHSDVAGPDGRSTACGCSYGLSSTFHRVHRP